MLRLFKENRLKLVSVFAISADVIVALAGGASYLSPGDIGSLSGICLFIGGVLGATGHVTLLLWGKGGKLEKITRASYAAPPIYIKPFLPWLYPLDFSFMLWSVKSLFYIASGILGSTLSLAAMGIFTMSAALLGWLWPEKKPIFGLRSMQLTASLYCCATLSGFVASVITASVILFVAMCMYLSCNIILYTVRKENQSAHTQAQDV